MMNEKEIQQSRDRYMQIPGYIRGYENQQHVLEQRNAELNLQIGNMQQTSIAPVENELRLLQARKTCLTAPAQIASLSERIIPLQAEVDVCNTQYQAKLADLAPIEAEITRLSNVIAAPQREIADLQSRLEKLKRRRQTVNSNLSYASSRLSSLETQQSFDFAFNHNPWIYGSHHHGHDHHHHYHGNGFLHAVGDGLMYTQIGSTRGDVSDYRDELRRVDNEIGSVERALYSAQTREHALQRELQQPLQLQQDLRAPHERTRLALLSRLNSNRQAKAALESERDQLRLNLLAAQNLLEGNARINALNDAGEIGKLIADAAQSQQQYLAQRAELEREQTVNRQNIEQIKAAIAALQRESSHLSVVLEYPNAVHRFEQLLRQMPLNASSDMQKLYRTGWNMLNCIKSEKTHTKLHADILNAASGVLETRGDLQALQHFEEVSRSNKSGKLSVVKNVFGAIGLFLGAGLAVAGAVLLSGFVPFIGLPIAAGCLVAGGALIASGISLLVSGRQKGLDKQIHDFKEIAPRAFGLFAPQMQQLQPFVDAEYYHNNFYPPIPSAPPFGH